MADLPNGAATAASSATSVDNSSLASRLARLRNWGMFILLLLLVTGIFILPAFIPDGTAWRVLTDIVMTLVLVSGVMAVADHRRLAVTLAALAVIVIAVRWTEWFVPAGILLTFRHMSTLSACVVLASAVGINVFARGRSIGDRVFGAVVLYLLIGLIASFAYSALYAMDSAAFSKPPAVDEGYDWLYFSFVTLTTLGYGDITPIARSARSLAMMEALIGQLYPAIIIARFVSLQGSTGK
jgi:Ion channel